MRLKSVRALLFAGAVATCGHAFAVTLRIADWNIASDINGVTTPQPGLNTVLQGIGNETVAGSAHRIDILALEETTSNAVTVQPIVNDLNGDYPGAKYQMSSYQATESGNFAASGNGPNAIVYNSSTVTLLASVGVGTPEGATNGEYRQVVRYEFKPVGGSSPFYVYVSHMKSGASALNATRRGEEAAIIRADEATLPASASVLYMGDLNSAPPEAEFTTLTAAGPGQAFDPANFSSSNEFLSESSTDLRYRDDYQLVTQNILDGTGAVHYVDGSFHNFGNDGSTPLFGTVNDPANTALSYMTAANGYSPTQADLLAALTTASDHLPAVADYTVSAVPLPTSFAQFLSTSGVLLVVGVCVGWKRKSQTFADALPSR